VGTVAGLAVLFMLGATCLAWKAVRPAPTVAEPPAVVAAIPSVPDAPPPAPLEPQLAAPAERSRPAAVQESVQLTPAPVSPTGPPRKTDTAPEARDAAPAAPSPLADVPPTPRAFPHHRPLAVDDLGRQLLLVPELDLESVPGASAKVLAAARVQRGQAPHVVPDLLVKRSDLKGLPMRMGLECQLGKESAENLQVLSRKLRNYLSGCVPQDGIDTRPDANVLRRNLLEGPDAERHDWEQPEAVPTLTQLLQAEDKPMRLLLVELVARIKGRAATHALVQRALFDLCDEVREAAVAALAERPRDEYRPALVEAFRYPWPPVADHAAEALVALRDRPALPDLVRLLDEPDPRLPTAPGGREGKAGTPVVREVVRVNHLKNCLLCHAPSMSTNEPVRGLVPTPGQPLGATPAAQYSGAVTGTFIRADVTYLKQDFSVPQPVDRPDAWPVNQRFDYLVRVRPATLDEVLELARRSETYPQREAVLFALRELTGKDAGRTAADWRPYLASAGPPGRMEVGR
jgi:hypothetical protein